MSKIRVLTGTLLTLLLSSPSFAFIVPVNPVELPPCDVLSPFPKPYGHELGTAPAFPIDERISSSYVDTTIQTCLEPPNPPGVFDNPAILNPLVSITNLTGTSWTNLYYVADSPETTIANYDGLINGALAFRIDYAGINVTLRSESILADEIFAPGETWEFLIIDYVNSRGLPPSALGSLGVPSLGDDLSSGSIVSVPEPATLALIALGFAGIGAQQRRKRLTA